MVSRQGGAPTEDWVVIDSVLTHCRGCMVQAEHKIQSADGDLQLRLRKAGVASGVV